MPKKRASVTRTQEVLSLPAGGLQAGTTAIPDFSAIIQSESLDLAEKRKKVLEQLGLRRPRKKYATPGERKEASKKRREGRKATRLEALKKYGLEPKKKGPKMSKEERGKKRSERGKSRREFMREMARGSPDLAKKYGIDPSRFKL